MDPARKQLTLSDLQTVITLATNWHRDLQEQATLGLVSPQQIHEAISSNYSKLTQLFKNQTGDQPTV